MMTTAPTPATVPVPVSPATTAPSLPSVPEPVPASRRSVLLLTAVVGLVTTAGLFYVLVDRPGLKEPLEATATVVSAVSAAVAVLWGISRTRH